MRESQERFNAFLDNAPIAAFVRNEAGRRVHGNKPWADPFARPLRELLNKTNWGLFPPETALLFEASDQSARARGEVHGLIESGLVPNGTRHWWRVYTFPLPGPQGEKWVGGLALDIADLIEARGRLHDFDTDPASRRLVSKAPSDPARASGRLPRRLRQVFDFDPCRLLRHAGGLGRTDERVARGDLPGDARSTARARVPAG